MPQFSGFLHLMDAPSYSSIWYWVLLLMGWTLVGRAVLGVPMDIVSRARRAPDGPEGLALLDWLSLNLPRWRVGPGDGVWLLALAAFVFGALAVLGFAYGLEAAQALVLLVLPFAVLLGMRLRLARRLLPLLAGAEAGDLAADEAAAQAARAIVVHRRWASVLSVLAVALTALWGTIWGLTHPFGV